MPSNYDYNEQFKDCLNMRPWRGAACWDGKGLISIIRELSNNQVETLVVGYGTATARGPLVDILNAAAEAGGLAGEGAFRFRQASSPQELATVLEDIRVNLLQKPDTGRPPGPPAPPSSGQEEGPVSLLMP